MSIKVELWKAIADRMLKMQGLKMPGRAELTRAEKSFLTVLAYFDGKRECRPALGTVAGIMGVSKTRAKELLSSLKTKGWVTMQRRRRDTSIYSIQDDAPVLEGLEFSLSRPELRGTEILTPKVDLRAGATGKDSINQEHNPIGIDPYQQRLKHMRSRDSTKAPITIGSCRSCGCDRIDWDVGCVTCGDEALPFLMTPHELESGEMLMPFGIVVTGLDSMAGRMAFWSEDGQLALQNAFAVVFGDVQPEMTQ